MPFVPHSLVKRSRRACARLKQRRSNSWVGLQRPIGPCARTVDNKHFNVGDNYVSAGTDELVGRFPLSAFGKSAITLQTGQLVVVDDVASGTFLLELGETLRPLECGSPQRPSPTRRGLGTDLVEGRIPYELAGIGKVTIEPGGAHCRLEFPLKDGESICRRQILSLEEFST